jgi:hypothetical protein
MEKTCVNCKYWGVDNFGWTAKGYNDYTAKTKESAGARICNEIADADGKGRKAYGVQGGKHETGAYTRHIETGPNFGCIHFKDK